MASDPLLNLGATRAHIIPKYQFIEFEATIFPDIFDCFKEDIRLFYGCF